MVEKIMRGGLLVLGAANVVAFIVPGGGWVLNAIAAGVCLLVFLITKE